jgi:hypothetical protein
LPSLQSFAVITKNKNNQNHQQLKVTFSKKFFFLQISIINVFKHKTGNQGPAYLTIYDDRLAKIMQLYCDHVRPQLLKVHPDKLDPKDGSLTFFVNNKGGKCAKIDGAFDWFKREVVEAGLQTEDDLRYLQVSSNFHFFCDENK